METRVSRPKYLRGVGPLPTSSTREEEAKRTHYRKFLKIRTYVFFVLAVCFLPLGIFLLVRFNAPDGLSYQTTVFFTLYEDETRASTGSSVARASGILLTVFGVTFAIITSVYCPTFTKLVSSRSGSVVYRPKSAEALTKIRYPRQPKQKMDQFPRAAVEMPQIYPPIPPASFHVEPSAPPPYSEIDEPK